MTVVDVTAEVTALLTFLEKRGLTEPEAVAIIGVTLESLIESDDEKWNFLQALESRFFPG